MKQKILTTAAIACMALGTFATCLATPVNGVITESGFGKYRIKDNTGLERLFYVGKKKTVYEPSDWWRPGVGDSVALECVEETRRGNPIMVIKSIRLVKAGPNTIKVESPAEVKITQVGRRAIRAQVAGRGQAIQFLRTRRMKVIPTGWIPVAGELARITFSTKASPFSSGINKTMSQVEKIKAFTPAKPPKRGPGKPKVIEPKAAEPETIDPASD